MIGIVQVATPDPSPAIVTPELPPHEVITATPSKNSTSPVIGAPEPGAVAETVAVYTTDALIKEGEPVVETSAVVVLAAPTVCVIGEDTADRR